MPAYDAVVIGGGPGGYTCAIRIAQQRGSVVLVERENLGGDCTNFGCIPTKALHASASCIDMIHNARRFGVVVKDCVPDYAAILERRNKIVKVSINGIKKLLEGNGVQIQQGIAEIISKNKVRVHGEILEAKNIVIATGSKARLLPNIMLNDTVITSRELLSLNQLPSSMIIIGGGYIGCELASIYARFGTKITLVEVGDHLLPNVDREISELLRKIMERDGIVVMTNAKVTAIQGNEVAYMLNTSSNKLRADKILIAVGLEPSFDKKQLDSLNIGYEKGITVNEKMQTSIKNIYAIGDVTGKVMLAHVASAQAIIAAENIMGKRTAMDYTTIPACIFTLPEISMVGVANAEDAGVKTGRFPFAASGKARCIEEIEGFVKVYIKNNKLIGCHIIGTQADSLISEAAVAIKNKIPVQTLKEVIHPHPTLSEAFSHALHDAYGEAIDIPPRRTQ